MVSCCFFLLPKRPPFPISLDEGDVAWCQGDIRLAKQAWAEAAKSDHPAAVAMAEFRMLQTASNLGWTVHGIRGDNALEQCSPYDAWCGLAWVDREIVLQQIGIPVNVELMQQRNILIESELPASGSSPSRLDGRRRTQLTDRAGTRRAGSVPQHHQMAVRQSRPFVGLGLTGGAMLGIGGMVKMSYPFSKTNFIQRLCVLHHSSCWSPFRSRGVGQNLGRNERHTAFKAAVL